MQQLKTAVLNDRATTQKRNTEKRHRMVYDYYMKLYNVREGNVRKFSNEYIISRCADHFAIASGTVQKIILKFD